MSTDGAHRQSTHPPGGLPNPAPCPSRAVRFIVQRGATSLGYAREGQIASYLYAPVRARRRRTLPSRAALAPASGRMV
eukprot:589154-Pleurochrysis_carterae.AAC.2